MEEEEAREQKSMVEEGEFTEKKQYMCCELG